MPTQAKSDPVAESIESTTEKVTELSQKAVENSKKASSVLLDSYEKALVAFAESYAKAGRSTNIEWISTLADAQADVAREVARSYTGAARSLVS
jgi:hypothetical protein